MTLSVEEIKKYNLGQTYKHINKLLKEEDFDPQIYVKYRQNLGVFEKKIQAIVIDTFKLKEGVINCLLSDDPHLLRRILKCKWFFEDAIPPKRYEEEIFPYVSISTRCKIINKLARNVKGEKNAEEFFQIISNSYGSKYAEMLLFKCSADFVSDYINKCKPSFIYHDSEKNLINICKRFPDIGISFLKKEMNKDGFRVSICSSLNLIKYLAKHYPHVLIPVLDRFYSDAYCFRLGRRYTKSLCTEFTTLMKKPMSILMDRVNVSVMFKCLPLKEQITFLKLLVHEHRLGFDYTGLKDWPQALSHMKSFLELMPPSKRPRVVETVFFELFNENYLDHPELWSLHFVEVFPEDYRRRLVDILDKTCEEKAVKDLLRSDCRDREREVKETYVYLMSVKNAFPKLTEMMCQMTTVGRREILLKEMVRNCVINKDPEGLESVVKYISVRHKNEDPRVICNLILQNMITSPKIINLNVWNWLEKTAAQLLVKLNDNYVFQVVLESFIAFKLRNNLDAQPQVRNMVKLSVIPSLNSFVLVRNMEKSYSRALIMLYYKEIFSGDSDYAPEPIKEKLILCLLMSVNDYNSTMRRKKINMEDLPLLVEGIGKMIRKMNSIKDKQAFSSAVIHNMYLKNRYAYCLLDISMKPKAIKYLVKYHPCHIVDSIDNILTSLLEISQYQNFDEIFVSRCHIDFMGLMPKIEGTVEDIFRKSPLPSVRLKALRSYSHIASAQDFRTLTRVYLPEEEEDDRYNFELGVPDLYEIQIHIPEIIKNVKPIAKIFQIVLKYLRKDYLRLLLPSLFAVCYNSSVSVIVPALKDYFQKKSDVGVRKIILCCILDLLTKSERFQYCQGLWESEKHPTVRRFLFRVISRSWKEDKSEEIFEMVKRCIREADETTINGRLKMKMIPPEFVSEYADTVWQFAEKYDGRNFSIKCKKEIVKHFNEDNVSTLSAEFCQKILRPYLFETKVDVEVEDFCSYYILKHPQPIDQKLAFVVGLMRERQARFTSVTYLLNRLKNYAKTDPGPVFAVFEGLLKEWQSVYGVSKMFKEYLFLRYMQGYGKAFNVSDSKKEIFGAVLGEEIRKVVSSVPKKERLVELIECTLGGFVNDFKFHDVLDLVIESFLGNSFGTVEGMIAIHLIPSTVFDSFKLNSDDPDYKNSYLVELREKYGGVFKKLLDKNDRVLKIYIDLRMNADLQY